MARAEGCGEHDQKGDSMASQRKKEETMIRSAQVIRSHS